MSMSIDDLSSVYALYGMSNLNQNSAQAVSAGEAEKKSMDGDSYVSTIAGIDPSAAIPSENYNDLVTMVKSASKSAGTVNATEYSGVTSGTAESAGAGASGGAGGGDESDDDEDTETEIVTINGQTYIQTTTTDSDGNTTVTRVPVGSAEM